MSAVGSSSASGGFAVVDNPHESRYELRRGDTLAGLIEYRSAGNALLFVHTEVDRTVEGEGLGSRLVAGALDDIRARGLRIVPLCPFVRAYVERHPEYADVLVLEEPGS